MTAATTPISLDAEQRATLTRLADELVPAALDMPSASEVDVPGEWADRVLAVRPDLGPGVLRVLDAAKGADPGTILRRLNEEDPEGIGALGTLVTGAYYLHPRVRELLGYPGQPNAPVSPGESDHYLRDGILDPVRKRGPVYRPTPT